MAKPDNPPVEQLITILDLLAEARTNVRSAAMLLSSSAVVTAGKVDVLAGLENNIGSVVQDIQQTWAYHFVNYIREQRERT